MDINGKIPIITIQGPTAVGKSKLALELAQKLNTELISADSRQIYRLLDIGTAKPSLQEQALVKHHLIDMVNPDEEYNAGDFIRDAGQIIRQLHSHGKIPIIVGGTGFYIKALQQGLVKLPEIPREIKQKLQQIANEQGSLFMHGYLESVDPEAARRINNNDMQKMLRALEVWEFTGKSLTQHWQEQQEIKEYNSFDILITAERENLYKRINQRVDKMLDMGLIKEIENLLKTGYKEDDPGMITVGYREFYPFFRGEMELEKCIELVKQHTRNYAKRQFTWFRKIDFDLTLPGNDINILSVIQKINEFREIG